MALPPKPSNMLGHANESTVSGTKEARVQATVGAPCSFVATNAKDLSDRLR